MKLPFPYPLFLLMIFAFSIFIECRGKIKTDGIIQNQKVTEKIETPLFNGKSLDGWEITDFGPQGPVYVSNGKIILGMGDGCTGITWKNEFPEMDYEISLEAMKVDGNDFFCGLTFPVNKSFCTLIIGGWGGMVVGLSCIDGLDASDNNLKLLRKFDDNTWYHIRLMVAAGKINAWINNENIIDFEIADHKLSVRPEVELSKPMGIASWQTTASLRDIKLKKIYQPDNQ